MGRHRCRHGVRTTSGRLVFAAYSSIAPVYDEGEVFTRSFVLYSDDGGSSWQRSLAPSDPVDDLYPSSLLLLAAETLARAK